MANGRCREERPVVPGSQLPMKLGDGPVDGISETSEPQRPPVTYSLGVNATTSTVTGVGPVNA